MLCETEDEASRSVRLRTTLRRSIVPCAPPSCDKDLKLLLCVICRNVKHKRCDKYRICEYDNAKKLIDATKYNQDSVFTRIANRLKDDEDGSVKSVVSADLYCHNLCRQNDIKPEAIEKLAITKIKSVLFNHRVPYSHVNTPWACANFYPWYTYNRIVSEILHTVPVHLTE